MLVSKGAKTQEEVDIEEIRIAKEDEKAIEIAKKDGGFLERAEFRQIAHDLTPDWLAALDLSLQ